MGKSFKIYDIMKVDYNTYQQQYFSCPNCGWEGKGIELEDGDFSEESFIGDLECPKCSHLIAFWQAPLT